MTKTTSINLQAAQRDALLKRGGNKQARVLLGDLILAEIRKELDEEISAEQADNKVFDALRPAVEKIVKTQMAIDRLVKSYSDGRMGGNTNVLSERNDLFTQLRRIDPGMTAEQFVQAVKKAWQNG